MKVLTTDHKYELDNFEGSKPQTLQFIHKSPNAADPTKLDTISDGTTNEEVLKVLLNRLKGLNDKFPCRQNPLAITKLQEALFWLNDRTEERKARNVEGKQLA